MEENKSQIEYNQKDMGVNIELKGKDIKELWGKFCETSKVTKIVTVLVIVFVLGLIFWGLKSSHIFGSSTTATQTMNSSTGNPVQIVNPVGSPTTIINEPQNPTSGPNITIEGNNTFKDVNTIFKLGAGSGMNVKLTNTKIGGFTNFVDAASGSQFNMDASGSQIEAWQNNGQ